MPMERMSMRHVRDCARLKNAGTSTREIARRVGVASSTVRLTLRRCEVAGIAWPLDAGLTDHVAGRKDVREEEGLLVRHIVRNLDRTNVGHRYPEIFCLAPDAVGLVALAERARARAADAPEFRVPRLVGMVLAHPADAFADGTGRVHAFDRP